MGDVCNPFDPSYDPILCGSTGSIEPPFTSGPVGPAAAPDISIVFPPIGVNISIPLSLGSTIASALGGVISQALTDEGNHIGNILHGVTDAILAGIAASALSLGKYITALQTGLVSALGRLATSIGQVLEKVFSDLLNGVTGVLKFIAGAITAVGKDIVGKIEALIEDIRRNGALALLPVLQATVIAIQEVRNIISAVELTIKGGLQNVVTGIAGVANGLGSIDATLGRALQQIGFLSGATTGATVTFPNGEFSLPWMQQFVEVASEPGGISDVSSVWQDLVTLTTACKRQSAVDALVKLGNTIANAPKWIAWLPNSVLDVVNVLVATGGVLKKQIDLGLEDANKVCPITKLDPAAAVEAVIRKFIDSSSLKEELNAQGFDDRRISVLLDLATQRLDTATLFDAGYRGIISSADRDTGLHALGYTDSQIHILENQSKALPTLADILRWWNYGVIDEGTADALFQILRFTPEQRDLIKQTYFTKETVQQQILLHGRLEASGQGYVAQTFSQPTPDEVLLAAKREQIGEGNARLQWLAHWQLPSYLTIMQSFFRQLRGLPDLHKAMTAENIPEEFWDELIRINRPLLPFRSIPAYLKSGIISEADAIYELTAHGFDPLHVKWITDFATKSAAGKAAGAVANVSNLSINTARTLFDDGAITQDQYVDVLVQHKFPHDVAVLQAEADATSFHARQRKEHITELIDEVLAGVVTIDDALSSLHAQGFTQAEIARFQKGVRKATINAVKRPTLADLKTFLKAQIITLEQFKTELQAQGWNDPWLAAFVKLETPPATP